MTKLFLPPLIFPFHWHLVHCQLNKPKDQFILILFAVSSGTYYISRSCDTDTASSTSNKYHKKNKWLALKEVCRQKKNKKKHTNLDTEFYQLITELKIYLMPLGRLQ